MVSRWFCQAVNCIILSAMDYDVEVVRILEKIGLVSRLVRCAVGTIDFLASLDSGKTSFALGQLKFASVTITR